MARSIQFLYLLSFSSSSFVTAFVAKYREEAVRGAQWTSHANFTNGEFLGVKDHWKTVF